MSRVLFLPGAVGAASFWHPVGALLPASWPLRYLAWPGFGNEPADPGVRSFDDLARLVGQHLDEPADLVAQSMGGAVAATVALRHPDRVRRLVLVATSAGLDIASLGGVDWRPDYRENYPAAQPWATAGLPAGLEHLDRIAAPTLLVWGDADPVSPVAVGRALAARLPNATLRIVRDGTHAMAVERAPEVARLITDHLGNDRAGG